jgi:HemY protein
MIRSIWFFIKLAVLVAVLSWFMRHPGQIRIDLPPWQLETSVAFFAVTICLVMIAGLGLLRFGDWAKSIKMRIERWREKQGLRSITRGLVAIAAGDADIAAREARRANRYLPSTPLRHLLLAQSEQLRGNRNGAAKHFVALMQDQDTGFLGLRGLLTQAIADGKYDHALQLARQAHKSQPKSVAVWRYLFELESRAHNWNLALPLLQKIERTRGWPREQCDEYAAAILVEQARLAEREGELATAARLYKKAFQRKPDFIPAATGYIESLYKSGYGFLADRALLRAWEKNPHPNLTHLALRYLSSKAVKLSKLLRRMAAIHPNDAAAHRATVEYAITQQLWGIAIGHARDMMRLAPTQNNFRLAQRLLQSLPANDSMLRLDARKLCDDYADTSKWQMDAAWACDDCHHAHHQWQANCPNCGEFHSLRWAPPRAFLPIKMGDRV